MHYNPYLLALGLFGAAVAPTPFFGTTFPAGSNVVSALFTHVSLWYIKHHEHSENCNCGVAKQIKLKLDEYEACGWKEASIWKIKMRNIL